MAESFHEYRYVRTIPGEPQLRWFQSDYFQLFIWSENNSPIAFRLCYNRGYRERAITWEKATGHIRHDAVDDGESIESYPRSPILIAQRHAIPAGVIERFQRTPGEVPFEIRQLVIEQLTTVP
jgi:hypothetical protein